MQFPKIAKKYDLKKCINKVISGWPGYQIFTLGQQKVNYVFSFL